MPLKGYKKSQEHIDKHRKTMEDCHKWLINRSDGLRYCNKCNQTLPIDSFYRNAAKKDGYEIYCKKCRKKYINERYRNDTKFAEMARENTRNWRKKNNKDKEPNREKFPDKYYARNQLYCAIKTGKINKPQYCFNCKKLCNPHGHHKDYSDPLNVEWLCSLCHGERHQNG